MSAQAAMWLLAVNTALKYYGLSCACVCVNSVINPLTTIERSLVGALFITTEAQRRLSGRAPSPSVFSEQLSEKNGTIFLHESKYLPLAKFIVLKERSYKDKDWPPTEYDRGNFDAPNIQSELSRQRRQALARGIYFFFCHRSCMDR